MLKSLPRSLSEKPTILNGSSPASPQGSLLLPEEAAEFLRVPRSQVMELARRRLLPCVHVGRFVRFRQQDLDVWAEKGGAHSELGVRHGYLQTR